MQQVCEAGTPCFLGWRCPSGSSLKLRAGRSNVGYRYWPQMKQWLCMLQGILLSMRSPWLCWAFFTQPVIYNWGVRKGKDFKYPREPIPCPAEWSSFSHCAIPLPTEHWPQIQGGLYLKSFCSRNAPCCMVSSVKASVWPKWQNINFIIPHLPDLFIPLYPLIQQTFIEYLPTTYETLF